MFRLMVRHSPAPFTTIVITLAQMCWLIFIWHNLLMVAPLGSPISGLLRYQRMLHSPRSLPRATCSVIILGLHKLPDQLCRQCRYGSIHEQATLTRLSLAPGSRLMPTWLRHGKPRENRWGKCRLPLYVGKLPMLTATATITNRSVRP